MLFQNPPTITVLAPVNGVAISVLRLDAIHPILGGNKFFKLKYNLEEAKNLGHKTIVTMGGAYSNHIAATALAGNESGFQTIGIIRGEYTDPLNLTLQRAQDLGMNLVFTDRSVYQTYRENFERVKEMYPDAYCIPEGGSNELAIKGCMEILQHVQTEFDTVMCAVGTGTTLAGITLSLKPHQQAIGVCVLNGASYIDEMVKNWIIRENGNPSRFSIIHDYHFGGYAKQDARLDKFVADFNDHQSFEIEPIYTGRLFYALKVLSNEKYFRKASRILMIHSGGLQYLHN